MLFQKNALLIVNENKKQKEKKMDIQEFKVKVVSDFIQKHSTLFSKMNKISHFLNDDDVSIYHAEGSIWTHTMMVLSHTETKLGAIAALLHDIGKTVAVTIDESQKIRFKGHESCSFFMVEEILQNLLPGLNKEETDAVKIAIALHGSFRGCKNLEEVAQKICGFTDLQIPLILELLKADSLGRINCNTKPRVLPWEVTVEQINKARNKKVIKKETELTFLIGLPAAGKSTFSWKIEYAGTPVLSRDSLIESFLPFGNYNEKWAKIHSNPKILNKFENEFHERKKDLKDKSYIVDMTNLSKKSRASFNSYINMGKTHKKAVVFSTGIDTIFKRNSERGGKEISKEVIMKMAKSFSFPLFDEVDEIEII